MNVYRVSLIGHREIENIIEVEKNLFKAIGDLLNDKSFVEFQIGRDGEFDILAASCIKRLQMKLGDENSAITLVLPYKKANTEDLEKYYDSIIIPHEAACAHFKAAITIRNEWLARNTDLLIAYIRKNNGGAVNCVKTAKKYGTPILYI